MKLKELVEEILNSEEFKNRLNSSELKTFNILYQTIYGLDLETYVDRIKQCDEFLECEELHILKTPLATTEYGESITIPSLKNVDEQKFKGKCYLLSLILTPEMYDPKKIHEPVLDGACITPIMYNPNTFEPHRKIVLSFSPESPQYESIYGLGNSNVMENLEENQMKKIKTKIHETIDKVFENPELYQVKGEKGLLVRGLFEIVETPEDVKKNDLSGIKMDTQTHTMVFFLDKQVSKEDESQINVVLEKMIIPIELKEKFMEELGDKSVNVTREEIENFLEKYKTK